MIKAIKMLNFSPSGPQMDGILNPACLDGTVRPSCPVFPPAGASAVAHCNPECPLFHLEEPFTLGWKARRKMGNQVTSYVAY